MFIILFLILCLVFLFLFVRLNEKSEAKHLISQKKPRIYLALSVVFLIFTIISIPFSARSSSSEQSHKSSSSISDDENDDDYESSSSTNDSSVSEKSSETSVSSSSSSSGLESSSSSSSADNSEKYLKKVESLSYGTASESEYDKDTNTLTYIGFDAWADYTHKDLQNMMDILETIANRQAVHYGMHNPAIDIKLPDGTLIAQSDGTDDIEFVK